MLASPDLSRRFFLRGKVTTASKANSLVIRPPWAQSESFFVEACSRCDDCISACPQSIIIRGVGGFPKISFKLGECTFCMECIKVCKTGALDATLLNKKINQKKIEQVAWNLDISIHSKCLSLNAVVCRACGDNCETQAIQFKLKLGGISEPLITQNDCTGCGACVAVCPIDAVSIKPKLTKSIVT